MKLHYFFSTSIGFEKSLIPRKNIRQLKFYCMRYLGCAFFLFFLSCNDDNDDKSRILSFEALCSSPISGNIGENCTGDFLVHITNEDGVMNYSEELGFYVSFSVDKTIDCTILGVLCTGDYTDYMGATVNITADIHEFNSDYFPVVGGQILVTMTNLKIN